MVVLDASPVCTAFCSALQGIAGEEFAKLVLYVGTAAALWWTQKKNAAKLTSSVNEANGRAARAEERAIRATEHAALLTTRMPPSGYETITRPSSSTPPRPRVGERAPQPNAEPLSEPEPEPTFGTRNWENIRAEIGLMFDENGNRIAPKPDVSDTSRTTVPKSPRVPPRK